jgi:hypothetical protein
LLRPFDPVTLSFPRGAQIENDCPITRRQRANAAS